MAGLYVALFRERFIRLQHENKMLRVQQEECEREKIATLQAQLEESHKSQSELDTEIRYRMRLVYSCQCPCLFTLCVLTCSLTVSYAEFSPDYNIQIKQRAGQ